MSPRKAAPTRALRIDIRDQRLPGGRVTLSARTTRERVRGQREGMLRKLIDRGAEGLSIIARVQSRELRIEDVEEAYDAGDLASLRPIARGTDLSLGAARDRVLQTIRATRTEATHAAYEVVLGHIVEHFGVDRQMPTITTAECESYLHAAKVLKGTRGKGKAPWSPAQQRKVRAFASKLWNAEIKSAAERAYLADAKPEIVRNPWGHVERTRVRQTRIVFLQPEEWRTLIKAVRGTEAATPLALGCLAGLRLMEVAHLRTGIDVDLEKRVLHIQSREGERPWKPKSDHGQRDVPIGDELMEILQEHVAQKRVGARYFLHPYGHDRPFSSTGLRRLARLAFEAAGIKWGMAGDALVFHSLRHTFASWLVQRDVQIMKVAKLLGDRPEQVAKTYGHLMPTDLERAIAILDGVASGKEAM